MTPEEKESKRVAQREKYHSDREVILGKPWPEYRAEKLLATKAWKPKPLTPGQKAKYNETERLKALNNPDYANRRRELKNERNRQKSEAKRQEKDAIYEASKEQILEAKRLHKLEIKKRLTEKKRTANLTPEQLQNVRECDLKRRQTEKYQAWQKEYSKHRSRVRSEEQKAKDKAYTEAHKEAIATRMKKYRAENKDKINEYRRAHYLTPSYKESLSKLKAKYPENFRRRAQNRRTRKLHAEGSYAPQDIVSLFAWQKGLCAGCDASLVISGRGKFHIDHYLALSLGGTHWPNNLQLLCPKCNFSKSGVSPQEWENVIKPRLRGERELAA